MAAALAAVLIGAATASAQDDAASTQLVEVRTEDGLRFRVPPDWPIEKRGGGVGPIPVEEYVARKFASMEIRLRAMEQQLSSMELRVRLLETQMKSGQQRLRSGDAGP